jgi:hypothetical protein
MSSIHHLFVAPQPAPQHSPTDGCIEPHVVSDNPGPAHHVRPQGVDTTQFPVLPTPTMLGIPGYALAGAPPFPNVVATIRPIPQTHPRGAPALHRAVLYRRHPATLSFCIAQGDDIGFRVPTFMGHTSVDAIGMALLTGQGGSALYLCAYELSRLARLPGGESASQVLTRVAATANASYFAETVQRFNGFMHDIYGRVFEAPELIDAEASQFVRAANGYAMLTRMVPYSFTIEALHTKMADAKAIGQLTGLSELVFFNRVQALAEQQLASLSPVMTGEVSEEMQEALATPSDQERAEALLKLL